MLSVILLALLTLALSHWLFEPLLVLLKPLLDLAWLGWALLALLLWAFAGRSAG
ncbi:MAG: hypothetical protein VKO65_07145 [Cyanobacteriota bacterium]|nr:hypothetical protein [Cyanobacteriota bacterium]